MGRDVTGLRIDKKPNAKPNGASRDRVYVAPKISNGEAKQEEKVVGVGDTVYVAPKISSGEAKQEEKVVGVDGAKEIVNEGSQEMQDVLTVKSTNSKAGSPEQGKTKAELLKPNEKKLSSPVKLSPETDANGSSQTSHHSLRSSEVSTENSVPSMSIGDEVELTDAATSPSKMNEMHTPVIARKSQLHPLLMSGKHLQADRKKYHDEEDACSLASSVATSVRTIRSKVTVPMEPTFKSAERLARRKEYYTKLEEKHKALEAEKHEYAARSKEEEEAAIKQLRKTMTYRANPVPNFYRAGPPPKVELKKIPVTRAKSPNFTRRKSFGDAVRSTPDEKKPAARPARHSIGVPRNGIASPSTPKSKDTSATRSVKGPTKLKDSNGSNKTKASSKQVKETADTPRSKSKQTNPDIPVVEETITSHASEKSPDPALVEDEMNIEETAIIEDVNMNSEKVIEG